MTTTADSGKIEEAADRLVEAQRQFVPCAPVRDLIGASDVEAGYAVQELNTARRLEAGERLVGRKIGLTSPAVQRQLGVDQPDYGMLFDGMDMPNGGEIAAGTVMQPRCEAEIAFVLGRDLDDPRLTTADIIPAIDFALAAIEVVGSRIAEWDIRIADTIADNGSSGLFVLGQQPRKLSEIDLRTCGAVLERSGEAVSVGAGAASLGSPLNAVLWLAKVAASSGRPLRAGDLVLSGALGPMVPANPGDFFEARIAGLGTVGVGFAEGSKAV